MYGGKKLQEEVTQKTVSLVVQGTKMSGHLFSHAVSKYLQYRKEKRRDTKYNQKSPVKKVKVRELVREGAGVSSIAIQDEAIKKFERIARRNGVTYAIKKDKTTYPPTYYIFFRARDADVIETTLKEFTRKQLMKGRTPVIAEKLKKFKEFARQMEEKRGKLKKKEKVR